MQPEVPEHSVLCITTSWTVPGCPHVVEQGLRRSSVDGEAQGGPAVDDDGEDADPDGDHGHQHEEGCGDGGHHIGPHAGAVHESHAEWTAPAGRGGRPWG